MVHFCSDKVHSQKIVTTKPNLDHQMEDEEFNCYVSQLKDVTGLMDEN